MRARDENVVVCKSYDFSLRCVKLYKFLCDKGGNYIIGKQLLRSGTSICANIRESQCAQTKPDFLTKLYISLKEASETEYWIELLRDAGYISDKQAESMLTDCVELIKLLTSIIKSTKENDKPQSLTTVNYKL